MKADDLLSAARALIRREAPYFLSLVHGLIYHETEEVETLGVTPGMVVYYNPKFLEWLGKESKNEQEWVSKVAFCLLHEGNHPLRKHHQRAGDRDPDILNIAQDLPINQDLRTMGWSPPSIVCFPEKFNVPPGLTSEQYYDLLIQQKEQVMKLLGGCGGVCAGGCGGGSGGHGSDFEQQIDAEMGRSNAEQESIQKQIASSINEHMKGPGRGTLPGSWAEWVKRILEPPKIPWERTLRIQLTNACGRIEAGGYDYSRRRISKRSLVRGIVRPGLVSYTPEGAVIVDTSGSMSIKQIEIGLRETAGILRALGMDELWFLQADAIIACKPERGRVNRLRNMKIHGRGGTDFRPAIAALDKLRPRPQLAVYFTDLEGAFPQHPPKGIDVVWAVISNRRAPPPPWGKVVRIES